MKLNQVKFPQAKDRNRKLSQEDETALPSTEINPLEYWRTEFRWPTEYFEPESNMNHLLARKISSSYLRGKQSEASSAVPNPTTPSY
ncbi:hypothetical protein BJ875DRAFT_500718 [Amylocarpus encephaloides]|uniref:Uncharacterized protein n=1 Tax=Amylocarpus encephaloides TaxID=45428 RepID=A0A9P7Y7B8_9HELO|nr:hypothetical protein BJ875DRAFT_500718 [Amylocarpus encephaloides]